ncbi:phosphoribosylglycinamide formyltransferase [Roseospira visakhapatnamensis]|uniref:Phosphoribosylglycinamide formyltransferase n=1 Tax=Roseospira visakhapatnamensis TaxID=390880 RepID=A0A7W6RAL2_9PROT|nr:phosphoribosylglycinamide formyltransferase [Roseospira visakhapatnamensis]MBB4264870.1 phosphoribosylglycinamide formyltransferase-1 [Roseospira visakhapatnamensis]
MTESPTHPPRKTPIAVLISGRGSNMRALVDACDDATYPARVCLVLSNDPAAPGLAWAAEQGLPTAVIDHRAFSGRPAFEAALNARLVRAGAEWICLAGFMRLLTATFVNTWTGRLLNIHPSLLPAYKGLHTHARALAAGEREHGCSVHFVVPDMDAGPLIGQARVPVLPDDTPDSLAERVLGQEHGLYPACLAAALYGYPTLEAARAAGAAHTG